MPLLQHPPVIENNALQAWRIDLWQYSLHALLQGGFELLNPDEQERANRYYFEKHRRRFITARALLKLILSRYLGQPAHEITFTYNPYGKPALESDTLQFNLSHSRDTALLAISKQHALGVDLEFFSPRPYEGIGQKIFSAQENATLSQLPDALKETGFFHLWAQKEALIKAVGVGLSYPTQHIDLPVLPTQHPHLITTEAQPWKMLSFSPYPQCHAALCYHPDVHEIRLIKIEDNETFKSNSN